MPPAVLRRQRQFASARAAFQRALGMTPRDEPRRHARLRLQTRQSRRSDASCRSSEGSASATHVRRRATSPARTSAPPRQRLEMSGRRPTGDHRRTHALRSASRSGVSGRRFECRCRSLRPPAIAHECGGVSARACAEVAGFVERDCEPFSTASINRENLHLSNRMVTLFCDGLQTANGRASMTASRHNRARASSDAVSGFVLVAALLPLHVDEAMSTLVAGAPACLE